MKKYHQDSSRESEKRYKKQLSGLLNGERKRMGVPVNIASGFRQRERLISLLPPTLPNPSISHLQDVGSG
jgi:hypothetical protein